jgi:hypothetical protein
VKEWWRGCKPRLLGALIYPLARLICSTLRLRVEGIEPIESLTCGKIFCGWHGHSLIPGNYLRKRGYWVIISHSKDGEMQTAIFRKFGYQIIRGSTGRGGARALIEAIRVLKNGDSMCITPDGPRGPYGVVQEGVLMMAQKSGCALVPVGTYARPAWFAPTWDKYMAPWMFSKAVFLVGPPLYVPPDASPEVMEEVRAKLESEIHRLQAEAKERLMGQTQP